jgi:predicted nucleic acid-binding protein
VKNILDAGPLIAALNAADTFHQWSCETLDRLGPPFFTCPEAVAEAAAMTGDPAAIVEMIHAGELVLDFNLADHTEAVLRLLNKYRDRQIDLADACIIRMTELTRNCRVITVDRNDFQVYRRNGRDVIPALTPPL